MTRGNLVADYCHLLAKRWTTTLDFKGSAHHKILNGTFCHILFVDVKYFFWTLTYQASRRNKANKKSIVPTCIVCVPKLDVYSMSDGLAQCWFWFYHYFIIMKTNNAILPHYTRVEIYGKNMTDILKLGQISCVIRQHRGHLYTMSLTLFLPQITANMLFVCANPQSVRVTIITNLQIAIRRRVDVIWVARGFFFLFSINPH